MTVTIQSEKFRALLRRHAAGVVVVTEPGPRPAGFTGTSFTSVSLRPPLVSFCLDRHSSSWPAVGVAGHIGVHVPTEAQEHVARRFATSGIDRFADGLLRVVTSAAGGLSSGADRSGGPASAGTAWSWE